MSLRGANERVIVTTVMVLGLSVSAFAGDVDALFDLRLAPHETDALLSRGETLDLELYVQLSSAGTIPGVFGWSVFMDIDALEDGVISFKKNFVDEAGFPTVSKNGTDNSPQSGDFSRSAMINLGDDPIDLGSGWSHLASFSVKAVGLGTATYSFVNETPLRVWRMDFEDFSEANVSAVAAPTIVVAPEPGVGALLIVTCGMIGLRRWRK